MAESHVHARREGAVGILVLDKPATLNAFDLPMAHEFVSRARELADDPGVRCMLLRGGGDHFCAGGDLAAMRRAEDPSAYILDLARTANRALETFRTCGKPVLAELKGAVAGGGVGVAVAADMRIAADNAKLALAFLRVGLSPDMGSTWTLPRLIGRGRAFEMAATHEALPVMEAWRIGLINRVVRPAELEAKSMALAQELAALPPLAVAQLKDLLNASEHTPFERHLLEDSAAIARLAGTADFREGLEAFFGKRPPRFEGR